jgi:hypothetical protein
MTDQRKSLHDQVERVREEDIDYLADLITRFLHPAESPESQGIVFDPVPPGSITGAEIEEQRQQALAQLRASQSEMITRSIGRTAITRLGIDPSKIGEGRCSWSSSGGKSANFTASWFEGRIFNRLGTFHLKEPQVVTFERAHISERERELIYKVRVLTRIGDLEKEVTVSI